MNSTNHKCCCTIEAEAGPSQLSRADNNANLMNQHNSEYKGAIPKTKPAVKIKTSSSKKSSKHNNNLEDIPNLTSAVQSDNLQLNGVGLNSYFSLSNQAENLTGTKEQLNQPKIDLSTEVKAHDRLVVPISTSTCNGSRNKDSKLDFFQLSDDDDTLSISDDGCIYTYKGDQDADLPVSFFSLDMPIESPNPVNNRRQSSSPEMDFLEMDFDPGPTGEDFDGNTVNSAPTTEESPITNKNEEDNASSVVETKTNSDLKIKEQDEQIKDDVKIENKKKQVSISLNQNNSVNKERLQEVKVEENHVTMPWTCDVSERTVSTSPKALARNYHCVIGEVLSPTVSDTKNYTTFGKAKVNQNGVTCDNSDCIECSFLDISIHSDTAMIWSEQEASLKQITQIAPSACGPTAVLNVLNALKRPIPTIEKIKNHITTRTRAQTGSLTQYLLSRSVAGTTHVDIINCLHNITDGQVYARFFHMYPERVVNLRTWLAFWISKGAVPVATLNLQKCKPCQSGVIPDAWHHQMIYGVGPKEIFLVNPLERAAADKLWPQLCSESVLLIRREDVLPRWNVKTDLPELMKIKNYRWRSMNVVGQVANLVFESRRELRLGFKNTSHIKIPASYSSGITLVIPTNSPSCSLLRHCPELPILSTENMNK